MKGRCWKFGDNINTDLIIPARYLNLIEAAALAEHFMEDADPAFRKKINPGDIIVAGDNFGCGSSREHAPLAIKGAGISCVIARSFARIFFRNAINIGLPIVECGAASDDAKEGDIIAVDLDRGRIYNHTQKQEYRVEPFPEEMRAIISAGGLMNYVKSLAT